MNYIIGLIIFILSFYLLKNNDRKYRINKKIPGPIGLPLLGNAFQLKSMDGNLHLVFQKWYQQYGSIYRIRIGYHETVVLTGYPTLRKAFIENSEIFSKRYQLKSRLKLNGCRDIALENGETHNILKKIVLSEMTAIKVKRMENHIIQESEKLIKLLDEHANDGNPFEMNGYLHMFSLNVILRFTFGVDYPYDEVSQTQGIIKAVKDFFLLAGEPLTSDLFSFVKEASTNHPYFTTYSKLIKETEVLIKKFKKDLKSNDGIQSEEFETILSKLIKEYEKGNITWTGVTDTAIDMIAAGSDTSSNTMMYCLISLINEPTIQSKLYNNISTSIEKNEKVITHSKYRSSIPYLSMVIKETFRMYPIALLGIPHETTEDVEIDGYKIAAGTQIFQNIYSSHRSEEFFENSNQFIPERFIDSTSSNLNYGSDTKLVHFGIGVRDCVGKSLGECEIFTLLATLLNRYEFINPTDKPLNDVGKFGLAYQPPLTKLIIKKRK